MTSGQVPPPPLDGVLVGADAALPQCVGRGDTLELLHRAVRRGLRWIHVHGVGGVGKSTLLHAFARATREAGHDVGVSNAFFLPASPAVLSEVLFADDRDLYVLDTFERVQVLEMWVAERVLGSSPPPGVLMSAGRHPLSWRLATDGAALGAVAQFELRNLKPEDVDAYLSACGVAAERYDEIWRFSKGHPLALRVAASILSQDNRASFDIGDHPSALRFLMASLLDQTPTVLHRRALEVLAVNRTTTEDTLRRQLPGGDAAELFDWLCRQPITLLTPNGLSPHDLARQVLFSELSWRNPALARALATQAHIDAVERAATCPAAKLQHSIGDAVFAGGLRWRGAIELEEVPECYHDDMRPPDGDQIVDIVQRHQGAASAELVKYWLRRAPERFLVGRGRDGEVVAFMLLLDHASLKAEDLATDPAMVEFDKLIKRRAADIGYCPVARFYLMRDAPFRTENPGYHFLAEQLLIDLVFSREPTIGASIETKYIVDNFAEAQVHQQAAEFLIGDTTFFLTFEDYRENPALDLIRMHSDALTGPPQPVRPSQVISEEFENAVRDALKNFFSSEALRSNSLLESQLVVSRLGDDAVTALRDVLKRSVEDLSGAGGDDARQRRVLEATYFDPACPKQRRVASDLAMGYSTYRRHLRDATVHLTVQLWEREWSQRLEQKKRRGAEPQGSTATRARWGIVGRSA